MILLNYLLAVSACNCIFYLFYKVFLSRLTFFSINRWYLLITPLVCFAIPLIPLTIDGSHLISLTGNLQLVDSDKGVNWPGVVSEVNHSVSANSLSWTDKIGGAYCFIAGMLCVKLLMSLVAFWLGLKHRTIFWFDGVKVREGDAKWGNGSFFGHIFIHRGCLTEKELRWVLAHELAHVRLFHSFDKLLAQLVQSVLWLNPFSYLYAKAITENHEFEVDQLVTRGVEKAAYAELVLVLGQQGYGSAVNDFSMTPVRRRIITIFKQPSSHMKKITYVVTLPVAVFCTLAFGNRTTQPVIAPHTVSAEALRKLSAPSADTVPVFPERTDKQKVHHANGLPSDLERDSSNITSGELKYSATDSIRFSRDGKVINLYGNAVLEFMRGVTLIKLSAAHIQIDQNRHIVSAMGESRDAVTGEYKGSAKMSSEQMPGKSGPGSELKEGSKAEDHEMQADSITFSLRNLKGKAFGT